MKRSDLTIDQIFILIIALFSIATLIYMIYTLFLSKSQNYYCSQLATQKAFSPECKDYYPNTEKIKINSSNKDEILKIITGLIVSCYNKYYGSDLLFSLCYDFYISNSDTIINFNEIKEYVNKYSQFNPDRLDFYSSNNSNEFYPMRSIFIIYNESKIILWQ